MKKTLILISSLLIAASVSFAAAPTNSITYKIANNTDKTIYIFSGSNSGTWEKSIPANGVPVKPFEAYTNMLSGAGINSNIEVSKSVSVVNGHNMPNPNSFCTLYTQKSNYKATVVSHKNLGCSVLKKTSSQNMFVGLSVTNN